MHQMIEGESTSGGRYFFTKEIVMSLRAWRVFDSTIEIKERTQLTNPRLLSSQPQPSHPYETHLSFS